MYKGKQIAVVVPAYNEELLIGRTLDTMPDYVDRVVVVDDCSADGTVREVERRAAQQPERVVLLCRTENGGVGAAIATGYTWCRDQAMDVAVVMAGDAQMDPADMPALLDPVVDGRADYAKGNRLFTGDAWNQIPRVRYLGNSAMSLLTKIASGYWHVADSQSGYTAINLKALKTLDWSRMYRQYGQPNDLLVRLNIFNFRVCDVPVQPVYNIGEQSGIKPLQMIPRLSWLLFKLFLYRLWQKYVIRDFHPLVFFYTLGIALGVAGVPLTARIFYMWATTGRIPPINALAVMFAFISATQFVLFAMWFDMEANRDLKVGV
jgi:glycosyltransferase involved in cell wall biosynthesis